MQQSDVLVSRAALRDAIREDLDVRLAAGLVNADPSFDGAPVLTEPELRKALDEVFSVPLAPPDDQHAEVRTFATVVVHAVCPRCGLSATSIVYLSSELVVDDAHGELRVKAKSKPRTHVCGQAELPEAASEVEGQTTIADLLEGQDEDESPEEAGPTPDERFDQALSEREVEAPSDDQDDSLLPEPEVCPFPGCTRAPEHRGIHRDKDGRKVS